MVIRINKILFLLTVMMIVMVLYGGILLNLRYDASLVIMEGSNTQS